MREGLIGVGIGRGMRIMCHLKIRMSFPIRTSTRSSPGLSPRDLRSSKCRMERRRSKFEYEFLNFDLNIFEVDILMHDFRSSREHSKSNRIRNNFGAMNEKDHHDDGLMQSRYRLEPYETIDQRDGDEDGNIENELGKAPSRKNTSQI